jgi:hypothetical protein
MAGAGGRAKGGSGWRGFPRFRVGMFEKCLKNMSFGIFHLFHDFVGLNN